MRAGRQADSQRRRQRVIDAINHAANDGGDTSVSGIARAARVDRTFLYRHHDLLERIHALGACPPAGQHAGPAVSNASLQADLLAAHERAVRLAARIRQLEQRLSQTLGEHTWQQAGLGPPPDAASQDDKLRQLEQQLADLRIQLAHRDDELAAARTVNRELMARINRGST